MMEKYYKIVVYGGRKGPGDEKPRKKAVPDHNMVSTWLAFTSAELRRLARDMRGHPAVVVYRDGTTSRITI